MLRLLTTALLLRIVGDESEGVVQLPSRGVPLRTPKQCLSIQAGEISRSFTGKYIECNIVVATTAPSATPKARVKNVIRTTKSTPQQAVSPEGPAPPDPAPASRIRGCDKLHVLLAT
jgi:hypothetical protein